MYLHMHIHQGARYIENDTIPVDRVNIKGRLRFDLNAVVPMGFEPSFRLRAVRKITWDVYVVSSVNGKSVPSGYKADDFLTGQRIAATRHFDQAVIDSLHDHTV